MAWVNARCGAVDPWGRACVLEAGHAGDHGLQPPTQGSRSTRAPLIALGLLLAGALLAAWWVGRAGEPASPSAPVGSRVTVTVSGSRMVASEPISLEGTYRVEWEARSSSGRGCYHAAHLRTTDDRRAADIVATQVDGPRASGAAYVYSIDPGRYFVEANSGCDWTFTFIPE